MENSLIKTNVFKEELSRVLDFSGSEKTPRAKGREISRSHGPVGGIKNTWAPPREADLSETSAAATAKPEEQEQQEGTSEPPKREHQPPRTAAQTAAASTVHAAAAAAAAATQHILMKQQKPLLEQPIKTQQHVEHARRNKHSNHRCLCCGKKNTTHRWRRTVSLMNAGY